MLKALHIVFFAVVFAFVFSIPGKASSILLAAPCANGTIASLTVANFSCTLGDTTLSNFTFTPGNTVQTRNLVVFSESASTETIAFVRGPGFGTSTQTFSFTVTVDSPLASISEFDVNVQPAGTSPIFTSNATITGNNSGGQTASGPNPFLHTFTLSGDTIAGVTVAAGAGTANHLASVTNTFTLFVVPEPATLTLFGLGLAGLGFAGRRRRS